MREYLVTYVRASDVKRAPRPDSRLTLLSVKVEAKSAADAKNQAEKIPGRIVLETITGLAYLKGKSKFFIPYIRLEEFSALHKAAPVLDPRPAPKSTLRNVGLPIPQTVAVNTTSASSTIPARWPFWAVSDTFNEKPYICHDDVFPQSPYPRSFEGDPDEAENSDTLLSEDADDSSVALNILLALLFSLAILAYILHHFHII